MSDRDVREEAASIAHSLRRKIERERALGTGELLASGVAAARRQTGTPPTPVTRATATAPAEP